jgi:hypothetical protein
MPPIFHLGAASRLIDELKPSRLEPLSNAKHSLAPIGPMCWIGLAGLAARYYLER